MIAEVIGIHSIDDLGSIGIGGKRPKMMMKLPFAGVAAISGVVAVIGIRQLLSAHFLVLDTQPVGLQTSLPKEMGG